MIRFFFFSDREFSHGRIHSTIKQAKKVEMDMEVASVLFIPAIKNRIQNKTAPIITEAINNVT
jgi:hypothetical protein